MKYIKAKVTDDLKSILARLRSMKEEKTVQQEKPILTVTQRNAEGSDNNDFATDIFCKDAEKHIWKSSTPSISLLSISTMSNSTINDTSGYESDSFVSRIERSSSGYGSDYSQNTSVY